MEAGAVLDAGGNRDVDLVMEQLGAVPRAARARQGPPLTPAAAFVTRAAHGHRERQRRTFVGLALRDLNLGRHRRGALVGEKRIAHAFDGWRDGRKIDHDLVGEPASIVADLFPAVHGKRVSAEGTKRIPAHDTAVTIGFVQGEVNGRKRMSDVR